VLTITSTDGMVRRLGGMRWARLHQIVYVIAFLALIHYFQQTKADVSVPTFTAGLFTWLMGYRIVVKLWKVRGELSTPALVGLSLVVATLTFLAEAVGIAIVFNVSPLLVLQANLDFDVGLDMIRPGWLVLAAGLAVATVNFVCARLVKPRRNRTAPSRERASEPSRERALASAN
jgi:methionine sulfoxide reductase heme-binding subunit